MNPSTALHKPDHMLFGVAYYDEYMPYDRIDTDMQLIKAAGMNVIRIAESTWSTWEPSDGVFDFTHLHRMMEASVKYGLDVIIGTPTYAIPVWLAKKYPKILSFTKEGQLLYGHRQFTDITNPDYLFHAERIIRRLLEEVKDYPNIIGFQIDNETRSAGAASPETQALFVAKMQEKYPDIEDFNQAFGLDYWSNRIASWEDFPDVRGTINGSLSAAYKRFLRGVITDFFAWQKKIIDDYRKPGQFITHNFDYAWREYSYGIQPEVDQYDTAQHVDMAGVDIYHPTQEKLTGAEISFGGTVGRSLKKDNYLVLETQSQGRHSWLPYPGQLRLQAFSHLASGANSVMYWNWHSIHNSFESYWKGILSHNLQPGATYQEIAAFGKEVMPLQDQLLHLKKDCRIAIITDNASLTALDEYPLNEEAGAGNSKDYNDVLRYFYDAFYEMNLECDFVAKTDDWTGYDLLVVPCLYAVSEATVAALRAYVKNGGHALISFRSFFADEELKIYHDNQPHGLTDVIGATYDQFTRPEGVGLRLGEALCPGVDAQATGADDAELAQANCGVRVSAGSEELAQANCDARVSAGSEGLAQANCDADANAADGADTSAYNTSPRAQEWMELLHVTTADTWATYDHPFWGKYAAITHQSFGDGSATYLGCMTDGATLKTLIGKLCGIAGIEIPAATFPVIVKRGTNQYGERIAYYFNYSSKVQTVKHTEGDGVCLLTTAGDARSADTTTAVNSAGTAADSANRATVTADAATADDANRTDSAAGTATSPTPIHHGDTITLQPWDLQIVKH